ncbi:Glyco_trans_2-like domain-containing protein [Vibrio chagasii]|uniref:glycosyltransferase n=1 Tax=Vibrio coralliirubri TaxID=1516159 RepID=UPI000635AA0E|nr:glycosyltransferase [Vibrio coralliirubri]CAH7227941.1 Glyco_trans_2-like domain-containing protein [Vibrio chagasii]CDT48435.1 hypothetical protein VCR29J2_350043 [Vibrio coralliirubri]
MVKLSSYIICKNEEESIKDAILSLFNHVDEIIVVDTDSKDETINIIKSIKSKLIKLYHFEWDDDFSSARNFALSQVSYEWVITIDADEIIKEQFNLKEVILSAPEGTNAICPYIVSVTEDKKEKGYSIPRMFKTSDFYYYGYVHEQLTPYNSKIQCLSQIYIIHSGYKNDIIINKNKLKRNFLLSLSNYQEDLFDEFFIMYLIIDWTLYINSDKYITPSDIFKKLTKINNENYFKKAIDALLARYFNELDTFISIMSSLDNPTKIKAIKYIEVCDD